MSSTRDGKSEAASEGSGEARAQTRARHLRLDVRNVPEATPLHQTDRVVSRDRRLVRDEAWRVGQNEAWRAGQKRRENPRGNERHILKHVLRNPSTDDNTLESKIHGRYPLHI